MTENITYYRRKDKGSGPDMPRMLLHCCCAPCAVYTVDRLRKEGFDVTALWYNPNIHPFTEHRSRLEAMAALAADMDMPLIIAEGYEMIDYFRAVVGHEGDRCGHCFRMRLGRTAQTAREHGFDAFTTTLLISPYQKHELLKEVGEEVSGEHGVRFHYEDFRSGFRDSQRISREKGLYHQKYCGCIYSEWERFGKVDIAKVLGAE